MTTSQPKRLVELPGNNPATVDANIVVCVRVDYNEQGSFVVVHTTEGFGFGLHPDPDQTVKSFYKDVKETIWPPKRTRVSNE